MCGLEGGGYRKKREADAAGGEEGNALADKSYEKIKSSVGEGQMVAHDKKGRLKGGKKDIQGSNHKERGLHLSGCWGGDSAKKRKCCSIGTAAHGKMGRLSKRRGSGAGLGTPSRSSVIQEIGKSRVSKPQEACVCGTCGGGHCVCCL